MPHYPCKAPGESRKCRRLAAEHPLDPAKPADPQRATPEASRALAPCRWFSPRAPTERQAQQARSQLVVPAAPSARSARAIKPAREESPTCRLVRGRCCTRASSFPMWRARPSTTSTADAKAWMIESFQSHRRVIGKINPSEKHQQPAQLPADGQQGLKLGIKGVE